MPKLPARLPLTMARLACRHVRANIQPTNQDGLVLDSQRYQARGEHKSTIALRSRNEHFFHQYASHLANQKSKPETQKILSMLYFESQLALLSGVGNCDEMSAAAFVFLYRCQLSPLDLLMISYKYKPFPSLDMTPSVESEQHHKFVVIGRPIDSTLENPASWGKQAILCDPWSDLAMPVSNCQDFILNQQTELQFFNIQPMIRSDDQQLSLQIPTNKTATDEDESFAID